MVFIDLQKINEKEVPKQHINVIDDMYDVFMCERQKYVQNNREFWGLRRCALYNNA